MTQLNKFATDRAAGQELAEDHDSCVVFPRIDAFQIREYRIERKMTQEQFANHYGINVRTLRKWEGEPVNPRFTNAFRNILSDWMAGFSDRSKINPEIAISKLASHRDRNYLA